VTTTAHNPKQARIATTICTECFVSIPSEQTETHARWHETRDAANHVKETSK